MSIGSDVKALERLRARIRIRLEVGVGLGVSKEVGEGVWEEARVPLAARDEEVAPEEGWPAPPGT
jgi:hypothetical protein